MKKFKFFACVILFFTCVVNIKAEYKWVSIFDYTCNDPGYLLEFNDQTYIPLTQLTATELCELTHLSQGETCILKVYYDSYGLCDSCFTTYNYIPESYEYDGFWYYEDQGSLIAPDWYYGLCNINSNGLTPIDEEDYPDYTEEELEMLSVQSGRHFFIDATGFTYLRIQVLAWRYVNE